VVQRPRFPAQLDLTSGRPTPSRPAQVAAKPRPAPLVGTAPKSLLQDSAALRARMVQRLAGQGISSPEVLVVFFAVAWITSVGSASAISPCNG